MSYTPEHLSELNLLSQFQHCDSTTGIKVHSTAAEETIAAAQRLHEKGLTTQHDGGYLTIRGIDAAKHAQALLLVLGFEGS